MQSVGVKAANYLLNNHFDRIPSEFFRKERLVPKGLETEQHRKWRHEREREKRRQRKAEKYGAAGAGAGAATGVANDDDDDDDSDSRSPSRHRGSRGSSDRSESQDRRRDRDNRNSQQEQPYYYSAPPPPPAHQGFPPQGHPAFSSNQMNGQPQEEDFHPNPPYDPFASAVASPPPGQQNRGPTPQMGDHYYAPSPQPGSSASHRYDPSNYRPAGMPPPEDRYSPNNYQGYSPQQPGFGSPVSGGRYENDSRYSDDYPSGSGKQDRYDRDDRDKGRRRKSKSKSKKSRSSSTSSSESPNQVKRALHKNFDTSQDGMTAAGLGALAGGFIGNKFFGKGPLSTVAGVVIGGVGANAFEAREHRKKDRDSYAMKHGGRSSSGRRSRSEGASRASTSRHDVEDRRLARYRSDSEDDEDRSIKNEYSYGGFKDKIRRTLSRSRSRSRARSKSNGRQESTLRRGREDDGGEIGNGSDYGSDDSYDRRRRSRRRSNAGDGGNSDYYRDDSRV